MKNTTVLNSRKIELSTRVLENSELLNALKLAHEKKFRVRIFYGNPQTGTSWNEEHDVMGTVSNSTGETACLILVNNARSMGGGAILTSNIVRIDSIEHKKPLYVHPAFKVNLVRKGTDVFRTDENGKIQASFKTEKQAENYLSFMKGERYSK
jgi:hypothetical protein